jgi:hypothetical protein
MCRQLISCRNELMSGTVRTSLLVCLLPFTFAIVLMAKLYIYTSIVFTSLLKKRNMHRQRKKKIIRRRDMKITP